MKKIIAILVLLLVGTIGFFAYQANEKTIQKDFYEEAAVFFREEDYKKAIQYFEEAQEHKNIFSGRLTKELAYYRGEAYVMLEEYEEGIRIYDTLLSEYPTDSIPYIMKAYCLSGSGKEEAVAALYQEGYKNTKDSEFLYYLANQYITMECYEDALLVIHGDWQSIDEETERKLAFLEIVLYEEQLKYEKAYEIAKAYCEKYPEDEAGIKEKTFLETRK